MPLKDAWMLDAAREILSTYGVPEGFALNVVTIMRHARQKHDGFSEVLLPCPGCGFAPEYIANYGGYVTCVTDDCHVSGPEKDPTGEKWNAMYVHKPKEA